MFSGHRLLVADESLLRVNVYMKQDASISESLAYIWIYRPSLVIIWTNDGFLLSEPLGAYFNEISIKIQQVHSRKLIWKYCQQNVSHFVLASLGWDRVTWSAWGWHSSWAKHKYSITGINSSWPHGAIWHHKSRSSRTKTWQHLNICSPIFGKSHKQIRVKVKSHYTWHTCL